MVGSVVDARDEVVRADLSDVLLTSCRERLLQTRVLTELAEVGVGDDVVAVSLPTLLVEAGHGASKRVLVGGVRGGSDAKPCRGHRVAQPSALSSSVLRSCTRRPRARCRTDTTVRRRTRSSGRNGKNPGGHAVSCAGKGESLNGCGGVDCW